jgi:hypothetical protein
MALTNFKFPGVELRQEFVDIPATGQSTLGVVIVGKQFKSNTYAGWVYGGTASTIDFSEVENCTLDGDADAEVYVLDGLFKEFEVTTSGTGLTIASSTIATGNKSATVVFSEAVSGSTAFGTLPPTEGDTIDLTGTGTAIPCIITAINGATVTAAVIDNSTSITGSSVTKAGFYKTATGLITNATINGTTVSMPATPTAKIGGQTTDSTLVTSVAAYKVNVHYAVSTSLKLKSVGSYDDIRKEFGELGPNNYMALALAIALNAAKGNYVNYCSIKGPTGSGEYDEAEDYVNTLDYLDKFDEIYSVVPMTYDADVIKAVITAAENASDNYESKVRRTVWYGLETPASDIVENLVAARTAIGQSARAQAVWADDAVFNGVVIPNYVLAAAPAGIRAYEPTYRPISNLGYTFLSVLDTNSLTNSDLLALGKEGIWIIDNNFEGTPINKKQVTTAVSNNINLDEESIMANADSIALALCHIGENLVGCSNISPGLITALADSIKSVMGSFMLNKTGSVYIGPQLLSWSLDNIYQHPTMLDHIYAIITCEPPKPFNRFVMTLRIV